MTRSDFGGRPRPRPTALQIRASFSLADAAGRRRLPPRARRRGGLPVADPAVHVGLRPRLRHHRPAPARRRARRRGGLGGAARRRPAGRPRRRGRHRAEPRRDRGAGGESGLVGRAAARPDVAVRVLVRRRLGPPDRRADPGRRCRAHGRGRRAALLRAPVPARARHVVAGRRGRRRARSAALRAGAPLPRQPRAQLPPVLRGHHARRRTGRGRGRLRRHPRTDPRADRRRRHRPAGRSSGRSGGSGGVPGAAARVGARAPGSRWRRSWSRASSCPTGRWPAPPATTRCARSTASSSIPRPSRSSPSCTSG